MSTERAIAAVGRTDGFYGNPLIKILMPEKLRMVTDALSKAGMKKQIDAFILSMNRAAEKASPKAASIFIDAIKGMNMGDAQKILNGGDTPQQIFSKKKLPKIFTMHSSPLLPPAWVRQEPPNSLIIL